MSIEATLKLLATVSLFGMLCAITLNKVNAHRLFSITTLFALTALVAMKNGVIGVAIIWLVIGVGIPVAVFLVINIGGALVWGGDSQRAFSWAPAAAGGRSHAI